MIVFKANETNDNDKNLSPEHLYQKYFYSALVSNLI